METQIVHLLIIATVVFVAYIWRSIKNKDKKAEELFGFDLRSLALFRIVIACVILADLLNRLPDLDVFYSDNGLMPRALAVNYINVWCTSLYFISGRVEIIGILFFLAALFALLLLVGYRTRLMTFLSWLFLISLESRDALALDGGDFEMRLLLFWGIFLPLGACYSIDSALNTSNEKPAKRFFSMGSAAYCLQFAFIYWFSVILKLRHETWRNGTAVYFALTNVSLETSLSKILFESPMNVFHFLTNSVIFFEVLGPLLFFIPVFNGPIRTISVFGYIFMHQCFGACIDLEIFHLVSSSAAVHFIPSWFWERVDLFFKKNKETPSLKIYYDENNEFYKKILLIYRTFLIIPELEIVPSQGKKEKSYWAFIEHEGNVFYDFNAIKILFKVSLYFKPLYGVLKTGPVSKSGDFISNVLLNNKNLTAKLSGLLPYNPLNLKSPAIVNIIATYLIFNVLAINLWSLDNKKYDFPRPFMALLSFLSIDQMWGMYTAPDGWASGWPVTIGKLKDGTELDVFRNGQPVTWDKPKIGCEMYKNRNWRRYILSVLSDPTYQPNLPYFAGNICKEWNSTHKGDKELQEFDIYFMKWDPKPNHEFVKGEKSFIWKQYCFYNERTVDEIIKSVSENDKGNAITSVVDLYSSASLFIYQQKYDKAEILYKKAIELLELEYGTNDEKLAQSLTALEVIQRLQGKNEEAAATNNRIKNLAPTPKDKDENK